MSNAKKTNMTYDKVNDEFRLYLETNDRTGKKRFEHMDKDRMKEVVKDFYPKLTVQNRKHAIDMLDQLSK